MIQLDTNRSDLLKILEDIFHPPFPVYWDAGDFETNWRFEVSNGVGVFRVTLIHPESEDTETFEWELILTG